MLPVDRVIIKQAGSPIHTLDNEMVFFRVKTALTSGIGTFSFALASKKGQSYKYYDVALFDTVEFYFDYDTVPATANFIGKICQITGTLDAQGGYQRIFRGYDQGEILKRRMQDPKFWNGVAGNTIVTDIANDLSLGTGDIQATAITEIIDVETITYFDLMKRVSDYWSSAVNQIKRDFYVDNDNDLVWKDRPLRTTGVETLTVGDNIDAYKVHRDIAEVKNKIHIYGKFDVDAPMQTPEDENWTETAGSPPPGWTLTTGDSLTAVGAVPNPAEGSLCVKGDAFNDAGTFKLQFRRDFSTKYERVSGRAQTTVNSFDEIHLQVYESVISATETRLLAPDATNYFSQATPGNPPLWVTYDLDLESGWASTGSPDITDIQAVEWWAQNLIGDFYVAIDDLRLEGGRYYFVAEDSTSQTDYGVRETIHVDDVLRSQGDCEKRGETLLYQKKDPPTQIEIVTKGNTNILIGDRLSISIPAENISSASYDVIEVEHTSPPFRTRVLMVNSANIRRAAASTSMAYLLRDINERVGLIGRSEKTRFVG